MERASKISRGTRTRGRGERETTLTEHHTPSSKDLSVVESKDSTEEASDLVNGDDGTLNGSGVDWGTRRKEVRSRREPIVDQEEIKLTIIDSSRLGLVELVVELSGGNCRKEREKEARSANWATERDVLALDVVAARVKKKKRAKVNSLIPAMTP